MYKILFIARYANVCGNVCDVCKPSHPGYVTLPGTEASGTIAQGFKNIVFTCIAEEAGANSVGYYYG